MAIDENLRAIAWGYSDNFRTGLRTEDAVARPTPLKAKAIADIKYTFAGCGGQFSIVAGVTPS
jgi:regulator of chromosome condensation